MTKMARDPHARILFVIITDQISEFLMRGSLAEKYYNPGDFFDEVHILLINDDTPPIEDVQKAVGSARLYLHNLPINTMGILLRTCGWRRWLTQRYITPALELAKDIRPDLIRCYGGIFGGFVAAKIKENYGTPYVVSLHSSMHEKTGNMYHDIRNWCVQKLGYSLFRYGLVHADMVMPVYKSIYTELDDMRIPRYNVFYNIIPSEHIKRKENYDLHDPVRVVTSGRLIQGKMPENIIRAVARLEKVELTVYGDGPGYKLLEELRKECGVHERLHLVNTYSKKELLDAVYEADIYVAYSTFCGMTIDVMNALLTGVPVIHNRSTRRTVPDYDDVPGLLLVENSAEAYEGAIRALCADSAYRERCGRDASDYAWRTFGPDVAENNEVALYAALVGSGSLMDE